MTAHMPIAPPNVRQEATDLASIRAEAARLICVMQGHARALNDLQQQIAGLIGLAEDLEGHAAAQVQQLELLWPKHSGPTMAEIAARVAAETRVTVGVIRGPSRRRTAFMARAMFCAAAHRAGFSLNRIGRYLGGRDHTSIMAAARRESAAFAYFGGEK